jgi:NAD(P)-dependent dehydrogenase (short-subunit alcohol dehydrogenase family)
MSTTHKGKIALVTGANKGIGREIARQLATKGMTVYIGARDADRGKKAADELIKEGADARFVQLEVSNEDSARAAAASIEKAHGRLDVLVNNAGVFIEGDAKPSTVTMDLVRKTYDTNVFGVIAVIQAMLPLLRKSEAGRIVNMSSGLGSLTQHSDPKWDFYGFNVLAYNSSKSAVNAITVSFAEELRDTMIKVNAADPGYVSTDMNAHSGPRSVEQGASEPVRLATLPADGPTGGYFSEDGPVPW